MTQILNKWKLDSIFEKKDEQGNYTNDALMYQDILRYFEVINKTVLQNNPFELRELQKWIVQNNKQIREDYRGSKAHTSINNKIHNKEGRIKNKFEGLLHLLLIKRGETMTKNVQVSESLYRDRKTFEYTREGIFLGLIIKSMNLKKVINTARAEHEITKDQKELEKTYQDIYDILGLLFKANENSSANTIFYLKLFTKCKDKGVFNQFVELIHNIINTDNNIINISELFGRIVHHAFFSKQSPTEFRKVLYETVEELDEEVKELVLYYMKLFAEGQYENKQQDSTRQYEEFRFNLRNDYERIAVQRYCENCKSKQNLALHYWDLISPTDNDGKRAKCPSCNSSLKYDQD
jgi:hypothetical protein